jgi:dihydrofolate reductase
VAELDGAQGDVAEAVQALKQQDGGDLLVVGSTQLVQTLVENDLVDKLQVMIDPLIVTTTGAILPPTRRPKPDLAAEASNVSRPDPSGADS